MIVDCSLKQNAFICATLLQKVWHRARQTLGHDTAGKWVRMLCISSHLSVQGYDSSSANINWREFFRRENKLFSTGGLPTEETMTRSAKAMTGATNFVAMFNFSISVTKFTPVATILFLLSEICAGWSSTETFLKKTTLFVLVWAYPCEMKTSYSIEKTIYT